MSAAIPCPVCWRQLRLAEPGVSWIPSTGVCCRCYERGIAAPPDVWCFGDRASRDPDSEECGRLCPDREICAAVVDGTVEFRDGRVAKGTAA